jgi:hypothetical protein
MVIARIAAVVVVVALAGLLTPVATSWGRTQTTDMRIVISVLLLAPPAFCMGMMFPLGLSIWRRHADLTSFFWAANGIMSMTASVFGMALSIELGIARTYAIGAMFYVICGLALFSGWLLNRQGLGARAAGKAKPRLSPRTLGARAGVSSGEPA